MYFLCNLLFPLFFNSFKFDFLCGNFQTSRTPILVLAARKACNSNHVKCSAINQITYIASNGRTATLALIIQLQLGKKQKRSYEKTI